MAVQVRLPLVVVVEMQAQVHSFLFQNKKLIGKISPDTDTEKENVYEEGDESPSDDSDDDIAGAEATGPSGGGVAGAFLEDVDLDLTFD